MKTRTCAALAAIAVSMAVSMTSWAGDDTPRYIAAGGAAASFPFSEAVWVGDTLYVSGNIGLDAQNKPPADPAAEAKLVMDAIKGTVERAGLTMDDLVSVTVYCSDLSLFSTFNGVYRGYFHGHFPARAFIGVAHILFDAHFEVQAIAAGKPAAAKK
jgi:2-iminobutanoate/2-iminopropanoate deaminase